MRLDAAVKRLRRADIHNVERHLIEAGDKWAKRAAGRYDRVLVDAPCTGTGTWRRNPDARFRLTPQDLAELVTKQGEILDSAARLLKPSGKLVYATCSVLPEENDQQVSAFLARNAAFRLVPLAQAWGGVSDAPVPCPGAQLALSPATHGTDGFFAAVLEKRL
jgi:16S rRNA (cytosine967-C5)-methyltransferase